SGAEPALKPLPLEADLFLELRLRGNGQLDGRGIGVEIAADRACLPSPHLQEAGPGAVKPRAGISATKRGSDPRRHDRPLALREQAGLWQRESVRQRNARAVANRVDTGMAGLQGGTIDADPTAWLRQPALHQDRRRTVRR